MPRPRNPKTDANHGIVRQFCELVNYEAHGLKLDCIDTSKLGGRTVDWMLAVGGVVVAVEVKTPEAYRTRDNGLTDGERAFFESWPGPREIVVTVEDVADVVYRYSRAAYVLEEVLR